MLDKVGFRVDDSAAARAHADEPSDIVLMIDRATFERVNAAALAQRKITPAIDGDAPVAPVCRTQSRMNSPVRRRGLHGQGAAPSARKRQCGCSSLPHTGAASGAPGVAPGPRQRTWS